MQRTGLVGILIVAALGVAHADPYPTVKKVKKINPNHTSYTLHDYRAKDKRPAAAPRQSANYAEIDVAPTLQAAPLAPPPPMPGGMVTGQTYSQTHNPGPSQLATNRAASFNSTIYSTGPNWGPFNNGFNGGFGPGFNGGFINNGFNAGFNGGFNNGFNGGFNNCAPRNGRGFRNRGFSNGGFNGGFGPGFQSNLTPQRFDPQPGQHPMSIQSPQMMR